MTKTAARRLEKEIALKNQTEKLWAVQGPNGSYVQDIDGQILLETKAGATATAHTFSSLKGGVYSLVYFK